MTAEVSTIDDFLDNLTYILPETSTLEDTTSNADSVALKARWPYFFFLLLLLVAIFFNAVVITSVFFYEKLHSLFYYGIASISAGHMVYMLLVAPFLIARSILEAFPFHSRWCQTWATLDSIVTAATNIHLCVLAYLLQIMFVNPLKYKLWHTRETVFKILGGTWFVSILLTIPSIVFWLRSNRSSNGPTDLPLQDLFGCGVLESSYIYSQVVPCYLTGTICFLGLFYRLLLGIKYQNMLARNLQSPGAKPGGLLNGKGPRKAKRQNSKGECSEVSSTNSEYSVNKGSVTDKAQQDVEIGNVIVHVDDSNIMQGVDPDLATDSGRSSMNEEAGVISELPDQVHTGPKQVHSSYDKETQQETTKDIGTEVDGKDPTDLQETTETDKGILNKNTLSHNKIDYSMEDNYASKSEESNENFRLVVKSNDHENVTPSHADPTNESCNENSAEKTSQNDQTISVSLKNDECEALPITAVSASEMDSKTNMSGEVLHAKEQNTDSNPSQDYSQNDCGLKTSNGQHKTGGCYEMDASNTSTQESYVQSDSANTLKTPLNQIYIKEGIENPSYIPDELPLASSDQNQENQHTTETEPSQAGTDENRSAVSLPKATRDEAVKETLPLSDPNDQECKIASQRPSILKKNNKEIELERVCSTKSVSFAHNVKKTTATRSSGKVSSASCSKSLTKSPGHRPKSPGPSHSKPKPQNRPALKLASAQEYMKKVNKAQGARLMTRISDNKETVLLLLVMYILYAGLTLPYQMYHIVVAVNRQTTKVEPVTENAQDLLSLLQWIATCATLVNPIVYWLFSEHFRKGYAESYISCCDRDQKYYRDRQKRFGMGKQENP